MRNILTIALTDLRIYLQDRGNLIGLIILPVVMTLFLGGTFNNSGGSRQSRVDLLDLDASEQSAAFVETLRSINPALIICPADQNDDNACNMDEDTTLDQDASIARMQDNAVDALLLLPEGYGEALSSGEMLQLPYYSDATIMSGDPVLQTINAALEQVNGAVAASRLVLGLGETLNVIDGVEDEAALSEAAFRRAEALWQAEPVVVSFTQTQDSGPDEDAPPGGFSQSVPGMATFFVVFSVLGAGMNGLVRERKQWTLQRLAVMPLRRSELLAGKILMHFLLGMLQFLIVFVVGIVVGINFGNDPIALLLVMVVYTLAITALGLALAPHMRNETQVGALTTLLALVLAALGGAWWPLSIAPPVMQAVGRLTPVAWAMDAFQQLLFYNGGLGDILLPVAVLAGIAALLFGVGILTFRYD